jgi:hypothetical protein
MPYDVNTSKEYQMLKNFLDGEYIYFRVSMGEKPKGWARKRKEYFILIKFSKRQGFCHNPYHRFLFFYYLKKWQLEASK